MGDETVIQKSVQSSFVILHSQLPPSMAIIIVSKSLPTSLRPCCCCLRPCVTVAL